MGQKNTGTKKMTSIELGQYHEEILTRLLNAGKGYGTKVDVLRRALECLEEKVFGTKVISNQT